MFISNIISNLFNLYVCYLIQFDCLNKILRNYDYFYISNKALNKIIIFILCQIIKIILN